MALELKGSQFDVNQNLETEGVWENLGDGAWLLVARAGNDNFSAEYNKIPRTVRRKIENPPKGSEHFRDEKICELMANTILLDWRGLADEGKEVKYSKENAKKLLLKYPEFRDFVFQLSNDPNRFLAEGEEPSEESDAKG